jgi:hypothetical protein
MCSYDTELALKGRTFRMVHRNDPVPRVPVTTLGYRHVGTHVYLNSTAPTCAAVGLPEKECQPSCVAAEHYTDQYLPAIEACVNRSKAIDFTKCPMPWALTPIEYDMIAGKPPAPPAGEGEAPPNSSPKPSSALHLLGPCLVGYVLWTAAVGLAISGLGAAI